MKFIRILFLMILSTYVFAGDTDTLSSIIDNGANNSFGLNGYKRVIIRNDTGGPIGFNFSAEANGKDNLLTASISGRDYRFQYMNAIDTYLGDGESVEVYLRPLSTYANDDKREMAHLAGFDIGYKDLSLFFAISGRAPKEGGGIILKSVRNKMMGWNVTKNINVSKYMSFTLIISKFDQGITKLNPGYKIKAEREIPDL